MFRHFITKYTDIFCLKNERIFQHFSHFSTKDFGIFKILAFVILTNCNFNKTLNNDVSFEQLGPDFQGPVVQSILSLTSSLRIVLPLYNQLH